MIKIKRIIASSLSFLLLMGSLLSSGIFNLSVSAASVGNTENISASSNVRAESDEYIASKQYDIVVYGDTAAAVVAAVAASRQGATVALVAPNTQLGGMLTGGLFATDIGNANVIGGMSREFYERNAAKKGKTNTVDWYFEPHVAEEIFADMINETKATSYPVEVFLGERLVENAGVVMTGATITKIICESGKEFVGKNFIDASYEGDLMAQAGVTYTYGREGRDEYGESLAGVVDPSVQGANNHNFNFKILARDENGNLKYQEVSEEPLAPIGSGDKKIQAYNFRVCLTNVKENRIPFPMPEGYDPTRYALLADYIKAWIAAKGSAPKVKDLFLIGPEVNGKYDFNNWGAFSTDYIGGNYNYPDSTYAEREEIWNEHYKYIAGLFYFLANDESVPVAVRNAMNEWGLPKDEYVETNNWTFQLYVREGRRMIGEYVMTQKDIEKGGGTNLTKTDTIGMGSYNSDSHHVQRYITADGYIRNEGNMEVTVDPYEISYRMLLPQRAEADNLLVTCTFSASHVAYSTIRMEPQYMIIGEAAGTAAAISIQDNAKVHDINVPKLQRILADNGGVLSLTKAEFLTVEFDESFDNSGKWSISAASGNAPTITQNGSYINVHRNAMGNYSYITRNNFSAPTEDFTYGFNAKLGSKGKVEFTVRGAEYIVRVVLTYNGNNAGLVSDAYTGASKSIQLNTSEWHDYMVVVKKGADGKYSYNLYVDGELAWENCTNTSGSGNSIFKIGIDQTHYVGQDTELDLDIDSVYLHLGDDSAKCDHSVVIDEVINPTCTEEGYTKATCQICGDTVIHSNKDALGHNWIDATEENPKTCTRCGKTEGEPLPSPVDPNTPSDSNNTNHENCESNWFAEFINAIVNFFCRLFGFPEKCVCGEEL